MTITHLDALIAPTQAQVHPNGLRHIRPDGRINQWQPPGNATVQKATSNTRQVALALTGGTVFLFELAAGGSGMLQVHLPHMFLPP